MKKRILACSLLLLFFPVLILCTAQCQNDFGKGIIGISRNAASVVPGETQWEKKIYWTGTIDDDFDGNHVLLVMDKNVGGVNKVHEKSFFGGIEIESIEDLSKLTGDINDKGINWEIWRQLLCLTLPGDSKENIVRAIRQLEKIDGIISAEPSGFAWPYATEPDDQYYGSQWGLKGPAGIQAPLAWDVTTGSSQVHVGIIDSGIANHTDLNANLVAGWDFYNNNAVTNDPPNEHGTHVAGIVGAVGNNNGEGISGVCWNVKLVPLQVIDPSSGSFPILKVINAINYATNHGIPVVNYSAGWSTNHAQEKQAISQYPGLFVCAVGNDDKNNDTNPDYPSNYRLPNIIAVGAIKENGQRPTVADWGYNNGKPQGSNYGSTNVDLFAPGDNIYSTISGNYAYKFGTSMAAPHVAGVAALILSLHPYMTGEQLRYVIRNSVSPLSQPNLCSTGGRLNAYNAVNISGYKFVAVVIAGSTTTYSLNGIDWNATTMPSSLDLLSVCYGNGKFVAVAYSNNKAVYSTNGTTWTAATLPSSTTWNTVCYGNGKFVTLAGNSNKAAYSTNGTTWAAATLPSSADWRSVCYGNGKFITVASNSNKAAYSTNGTTWTAATLPRSAAWRSVCYGNDKFVAVADSINKVAYSTDGITWTEATLPSSYYTWISVCYGNGKFVAVASNSDRAVYSTNGTTWTETTLSYNRDWRSVCYGNGKFITVASNSDKASYSTNGITWIDATLPNSAYWQSVCFGGY